MQLGNVPTFWFFLGTHGTLVAKEHLRNQATNYIAEEEEEQ